jgi:aspartate dehydrogenase
MTRRLLVIGYGAIAAELIDRLRAQPSERFDLAVLLRPESASIKQVPDGVRVTLSLDDAMSFGPGLVVEAAGHGAVRVFAEHFLNAGVSFLAVSVGALADDALFSTLREAAVRGGARLILPAGAIGSLDYLHAVSSLPDTVVAYESRKPPGAWVDELAARGMTGTPVESTTLFEGGAREAAVRYPNNLNVAASLALAGTGFERTRVRIVVDPSANGNTHRIAITGSFGECHTEIVNRPSPANAKTSWVVVLSVLAAIDRHYSPVILG